MQEANTLLTIPAVVTAAAKRFGSDIAIASERRLSFIDLEIESLRAATLLQSYGVERGDRIAIWAPNSIDWIVACIGAQWLGAVVVPINTRLKGAETQFILNKSRARVLLTVTEFLSIDYLALLNELELPHLQHRIVLDAQWRDAVVRSAPLTDPEGLLAQLSPQAPSDLLFTSGTTGEPKGVVSSHRQTVEVFAMWSERVGLRRGDRYAIVNPFFHSFGYKAGWLSCLLRGATAYPIAKLDVGALAMLVQRERITVLPGPPTLFQTLLMSEVPAQVFASIRLSITGAAVVPPVLIERMRNELGIAHVLTGYGLTECGVATVSDANDAAEIVAKTAGKPLPGVEVICVDHNGEAVANGESGEIWIRGFNVMQGYFEDAAATAAAIDANGWLHSGDIGRFDADGNLQITDRLKDMFISGGFNCYPAEIENLLCRHPDVAQACVIGIADTRLGEVGKAFVVPRSDRPLQADQLLAWCRANMANYKVPHAVEIVAALPTNAAGKVQKFLLRNA